MCKGLFGKIMGHNFIQCYCTKEERYSGKEIEENAKVLLSTNAQENVIKTLANKIKSKEQVYVQSVCRRCGMVTEKVNVLK